MKRKKQNPINNPAKKLKKKANESAQAKAPVVPTSIVQCDCSVADIALVNAAEADKVARPVVSILKDKPTGLIVGFSMQPPTRQDLAGIVERIFSKQQPPNNWSRGKE